MNFLCCSPFFSSLPSCPPTPTPSAVLAMVFSLPDTGFHMDPTDCQTLVTYYSSLSHFAPKEPKARQNKYVCVKAFF